MARVLILLLRCLLCFTGNDSGVMSHSSFVGHAYTFKFSLFPPMMNTPLVNNFSCKEFTYFWIMSFGWIPRNRITESKGMNIFNAFNSLHIFI